MKMNLDLDYAIANGCLIIKLSETSGPETIAELFIGIEELFDEHARILEERRVAHARHQSNPDRYPAP